MSEYYTKSEADEKFSTKLEVEKTLKKEREESEMRIVKSTLKLEQRIDLHHEDLANISVTLATISEVLRENSNNLNDHTRQEMARFDSIAKDIAEIRRRRDDDQREDLKRIVDLEKKNSLLKGIGIAITFFFGSGILLAFLPSL